MQPATWQSHAGPVRWNWGQRTFVMGILNVTPDSFSDGGQYDTLERAVAHARQMEDAGADVIDVGGESTRPGADPVDAVTEQERVLPVIKALSEAITIPISIDTYKSEVAEGALAAGASMINDVWGLQRDPQLAELAAAAGVPLVVMHNQGQASYRDLVEDVVTRLRESVHLAQSAGVPAERLIIDPGFGFAKGKQQNLELMRRLHEFKQQLDFPLLLGPSRKSTIGSVLDLPASERVEGTAALVALGIDAGADLVRVHDVREMVRVARMTDAVCREDDRSAGSGQVVASPAQVPGLAAGPEGPTSDLAQVGALRRWIELKGLEFYAYHGALEAEQQLGQRFVVDLQMAVDWHGAATADDLDQTVNYAAVYEQLQELVTAGPYRLVETLAERIAAAVLQEQPRVQVVRVRVHKPQAPLPGSFDDVIVETVQARHDGGGYGG